MMRRMAGDHREREKRLVLLKVPRCDINGVSERSVSRGLGFIENSARRQRRCTDGVGEMNGF